MPDFMQTRNTVVASHAEVCAYRGSGTHHYNRQAVEHHGKGAKKYKSERRMIIDCGKSLYKWCVKIGVPVQFDWNKLSDDQRPKDGGRCASPQQK